MERNIPLTAAELTQIWGAYMDASSMKAIYAYFREKVNDEEVQPIIQEALDLSTNHEMSLKEFFEKEKHPVPVGFTDEDVNINAPKLYTDGYMHQHALQYASFGMAESTTALSMTAREDIYDYFKRTHKEFNHLHEHATKVALQKGTFLRQPSIPTPKEVDFVKKQNFLTGFFGQRRPLLAPEVANLHSNIQRNSLGIDTLTGFSQVVKSDKVRTFILRGIDISKKHIAIFNDIMQESDIPVSAGSDAAVTDLSGESPFSDKLMMFLATSLIKLGIMFYGASITSNIRRDIASHIIRLCGEILLYSEDGANLMIDKGWLEEPPRMVDRDKLQNK